MPSAQKQKMVDQVARILASKKKRKRATTAMPYVSQKRRIR